MIGLTARQAELLAYIKSCETCPTYREMGRALGYSECNLTGPIAQLLNGLEEKGRIRRHRYRACSIEVLDRPTPRLAVIYTEADLDARAARKRALWREAA